MRKRILISFYCGFSVVALNVKGQQIPHYHHYFLNQMTYNPAATGLNTSTNAFFMRSHRNLGFEGGNIVNVLTVDGSLYQNKLGLGLAMFSDVMGPTSSAGGFLSGSYKVNFSEKTFLRFGIAAGAKDYRVNFNQAIVQDPNDPALMQNVAGRKIVPDVSAGLLFQLSGFRLGLTGFQLIGSKIKFNGLGNEDEITGLEHTFSRHFMATMQYDIKVSEKLELFITPYASAKYVAGAPFHYEGGFTADFKKWGWVNACYKADYGITGNLGVRIMRNFHVGYAYDVVINSSKSLAGLNQEILIGYTFPVKQEGRNDDRLVKKLERERDSVIALLNRRQIEKDSMISHHTADITKRIRTYDSMETTYLDSIAKLHELLKNKPEVVQQVDTLPKNIPNTRRSAAGDHFLEMNNSESPYGLYTIYGAFSKFELADQALARVKKDFPKARLIYNERNQYRYVVVEYSLQTPPVIEARNKALSLGMEKAWVLNYVR